MSSNTQTLEELAEYEYITQRTFQSESEGYEFFNAFARNKGFSIRKGKVTRGTDNGDVICRQFVCSKQGTREPKFLNMEKILRRPRPLTRSGCRYEVVIKWCPEKYLWYIHKYEDRHNHDMAKSNEVRFLYSHRKMSERQKKEIIAYQTAGLRKYQIMDVLEQQYGGPENIGHVSKDLYNFSSIYKRAKISDGDGNAVLQFMRQKQLEDSDFFFEYQTRRDGCLLNLFWCDGQSRLDYLAFGDLVIFDSTYRTNRYRMPFVPFVGLNHHRSTTIFACAIISHETVESFKWLLTTLLQAMYNRQPRSIITDGDHAMRKAIRVVLPNTDHRLCAWHIERNAARFLHYSMVPGFRKLLYMRGSPQKFEARWKSFLKKHNRKGKKHRRSKRSMWLTSMFINRRLWAASYLKDKFFLGAQSNQRSESLNSRLHKHLDRKMTLYDMVDHYFHCLSRIRRIESQLDCEASQSIPVAITEHKDLERSAANCFTPTIFYLIQKEIKLIDMYKISEILESENCTKYIVVSRSDTKVYEVDCDDEQTLGNVSCSCMKFECDGIPCCHIMVVLAAIGSPIPSCLVLNRWTLNAKAGLVFEGVDPVNSMKGTRLSELLMLAKPVFEEASCSMEEYLKWKEIFQEASKKKRKLDHLEQECGSPRDQDNVMESEAEMMNVKDPEVVKSKGAPKRLKSFMDKARIRKCSECKAIDHDKHDKSKGTWKNSTTDQGQVMHLC